MDQEPSRYGQFEVLVVPNRTPSGYPSTACQVSFRQEASARKLLFVAGDCTGELAENGEVRQEVVYPTDHLGKVVLPVVATNGDEFHVFEMMPGGNGAYPSEYWVAVIRENAAWAKPIGSPGIGDAQWYGSTSPPMLQLLESPTTTDPGARYSVTFGRVETLKLPMLESHPVSKATQVLTGKLYDGARITGFLPFIENGSADDPIIIHDPGDRRLSKRYGGSPVELTAERTTWSDGRETLKCLRVKAR